MNTSSTIKIYSSGKYKYIYVYFKYGSNIIRIPTGLKAIEGKMTQHNLFSAKVEGYEELNQQIKRLSWQVDSYIGDKLRDHFPKVSQKECKEYLKKKYRKDTLYPKRPDFSISELEESKSGKKKLLKCIEEYIEYRKSRATPRNTLKEFTTVKNRIEAFETERGKETYLGEINITWSDAFEGFLIRKQYLPGTIGKTYTILRTILYHYYRRREEMGITLSDKFTYPEFKRGEKSKNLANPLTEEQLEVLFKHKFEDIKLEKTRIRFVLQCATGLRFSDLHLITPDKISKERIVITPSKTKHQKPKPIYINLNKYSTKILSDLDYNTTGLKIENAPYNRNIKAMFAIMAMEYPKLKFKNNMSSHCGRDTFISICVQKGVDFKTILQWTGQSSYSIMDRYIYTTDAYKSKQMNKAFG